MPTYSDIDLFLLKNDLTEDINFKLNVHAVAQSIKNIILTRKGEQLFNSNFGSSLLEKLSTKRNPVELQVISDVVKSEIQIQETRATIDSVEITPLIDSYDVDVKFTLLSTESQGAVSITV